MKKIISYFLLFQFTFFINSCSPAYSLFVQNKSNENVKIFVELNNSKSKKYLEKYDLRKYLAVSNPKKLSSDSLRYYLRANLISNEKYIFTTDKNYELTLEPNILVNIEPNNSLEIYPFKKVYYIINDNKCFIIPQINNQENCNFIITREPKLVDLVEIK